MTLCLPGSHIISYKNIMPKIGRDCFLASGAQLIGDLECGDECSFWFNTVVRGDCNTIRIGKRVNVQDNTIIHVTNKAFPTNIADDVSIGHSAIIHGCTVEAGTLIGMGAKLMDGVTIGSGCLVAAGSIVTPGKTFEDGYLILGSPAKAVRKLNDHEKKMLKYTTEYYLEYKENYKGQTVIEGPKWQ